MFNVKTSAIEFMDFTAYSDASGATCTVHLGPYVYAANWLGEARLTLIRPVTGSRTESKIAADRCRRAFEVRVNQETTEQWRTACAAMYAA